MKFKLGLAAIVLALTPAMAVAMCGDRMKPVTASVCADGKIWDAKSASCVDPVTS
ncbi:MAG: hypothetical protein JJT99_03325 [Rhodobacteraceae bacterium]|nr:hypothetical protein [Paracoccaceae bacterium]